MNANIPYEYQKAAKRAARSWAEEKGVSRRTRRLAAFWAYQEDAVAYTEVKRRKRYLKEQIEDESDPDIRRLHRHHLSFIRWYWRRYDDCDCDYCCGNTCCNCCYEEEKIEDTDMHRTGLSPQYPI